jgi:hypothetical protein
MHAGPRGHEKPAAVPSRGPRKDAQVVSMGRMRAIRVLGALTAELEDAEWQCVVSATTRVAAPPTSA